MRNDARNAVKALQSSDVLVDLLFIDPPYAEEKYYDLAMEFVQANLLSENAIIICEHEKQLTLPDSYGEYIKTKNPIYGNSAISIYMK